MIGIALAAILVLGVGAQWLAWRLRVPSILLLLLTGFLAGPVALWVCLHVLGLPPERAVFLDPEGIIPSPLLLSVVSMAVGVILFEGGLTLNFAEIRTVRRAVMSLVTVGALVTWVIGLLAARFILGLPWAVATLLGAILTVTGPTVIGPLLRFVRPTGTVGKVLKWEGIVIDPIGALLAVLVFEAIVSGHELADFESGLSAVWAFAWGAVKASMVGSAMGLAAAAGMVVMLRRFLIPDHLQVPVALAFVVAAFTASNALIPESGLFATTIMGIALANQSKVRMAHILEFKETLVLLLVALLFIVLSARLQLDQLAQISPLRAIGFMLILVVARVVGVFASTVNTKLSPREKFFLSWMAPRGIVAALVASVFGLALSQQDPPIDGAELLTPYVFLTIVFTVTAYGLPAMYVAQRLGVANPLNAGFIVAGATPLGREIARALNDEKIEVLLVDTNYANLQPARQAGVQVMVGNILSMQVMERLQLSGIGRLLALTPNDEVNSLAAVHFARHFGRSNVYQLASSSDRGHRKPEKEPAKRKKTEVVEEIKGRTLFARGLTHEELEERLASGAQLRRTKLTREFSYDDWRQRHGERAVPLFLIEDNGSLQVFTADRALTPKPGQTIIALTPLRSTTSEAPAPPEAAESSPPEASGAGVPGSSTSLDSAADAREPVGAPES